jgi:hypothetical protein
VAGGELLALMGFVLISSVVERQPRCATLPLNECGKWGNNIFTLHLVIFLKLNINNNLKGLYLCENK